ncbi:MAG: carotenoid biosynthesis protein [Cyclobacteriaceae bacterium]|nr:carotenoid biosynthesis protein [Cyclobacteriaceae bacterium]MDH4295053.1 carotenoid biosynthesis protein [Cyclobacteriaceae bacterium]MDH5249784.1 carotenoid biosynthesis protein [Cyclobacteriaceae bacterium]
MITITKHKSYYLNIEYISIGLVWLLQISALIGISLGYQQWFISKTPINLLLIFVLLIINFPISSPKSIAITFFFFAVGMLAEWIGIHGGFLFGRYSYGDSLGLKVGGVPFLIGLTWAILVLVTGVCSNHIAENRAIRMLIGAVLMVSLDFFMEASAPIFDFWTFAGNVTPLKNYMAWFVLGLLLHFVFQHSKLAGSKRFSVHVALALFLFFTYFRFFYRV